MPLRESDRIVFFDLETGGLDPSVHPVIQFAAVAVDGRLREVDAMEGRPYTVARMAGHNSRFDAEFLAAWFKASGDFLPGACFEALCTLHLARWASLGAEPGPKDHKLGSLCEWLDVPLGDSAHDALADVRATVAVARRLCFDYLGLGVRP